MAKMERQRIPSGGEDMEPLEFFHIATILENNVAKPTKLDISVPLIHQGDIFSLIYSQQKWVHMFGKDMYKNVHSSFIYNRSNLETA